MAVMNNNIPQTISPRLGRRIVRHVTNSKRPYIEQSKLISICFVCNVACSDTAEGRVSWVNGEACAVKSYNFDEVYVWENEYR